MRRCIRAAVLAACLCALGEVSAQPTGVDRSGFDARTRVQDDLFRAVNGGWLDATEMPPDKPVLGSFVVLRDLSDERVRAIAEGLVDRPPEGDADAARIAAFWRAYTDTATLERRGLKAVQPLFEQIDRLDTPGALLAWLGAHQAVIEGPLMLRIRPDAREPSMQRVHLMQGGLGLPDRDYYLLPDERYAQARAAYRHHLQTLFLLAGSPEPALWARQVFALEQQLAARQVDRVTNRDPKQAYNPMSLAQLRAAAPGVAWGALFDAAGLEDVEPLVVAQPGYVVGLAALLAEAPIVHWQRYLKAHLLDEASEVLPAAFREARFVFRDSVLRGTTAQRPRWQQAVGALNAALGEAVGRRYVALHYPPGHQARMQAMVQHLLRAFDESIGELRWMSAATKAQARDKLAKMQVKIGHPQRWRDDSGLELKPDDAFGNRLRVIRHEWQRQVARAGRPVLRDEWSTTPQTVNAFYSSPRNEIVFPAAVLQPPFFDPQADDAQNYGAIGAIIGHEISHGFDDRGSQFDGEGRLRNWWTAEDRAAFDALGARLVAQYGAYEPLAGKRINGRLTLGENIADLSGLQVAYKAWQRSLDGAPAPVIDGLSGAQRFFVGWSRAWRGKLRAEAELLRLTTDPHSPPRYRANGVAINHDAFHEAFGTRPGDGMFKPEAERIRLW
ncbi:M13 family metallopeptidase [Aquincola sp. S2]|uniref:M13 family metallopeptidase n=1 Tax=Pseudaquabacterium terrae TaxID=2732868 RepID=A0ABX2EID5_9BURK|nr:M13 family metallopeptidase [Aquabacterium terrae]NRF68391.1 M13 family metallopeptidase [Aquabacterium terrae]